MIPKIIHNVWVTDNPQKYPQFRETLVRHNPDYSFLFWTLHNLPYDAMSNNSRLICQDESIFFMVKCETIRHELLRIFGGIYIDHDMECLKPFDRFLNDKTFVGIEAEDGNIGTSIIGTSNEDGIVGDYAMYMQKFILENKDKCNLRPVQTIGERGKHYQECFSKATVYPMEYFYPFNCMEPEKRTLEYQNSYCKHYWNCKDKDGWMNKHKEFVDEKN